MTGLTRRSTVGAALTLLLMLAFPNGAQPASTATEADDSSLGTSRQSMIDVWTEHGVPAATQTRLLKKIDRGQPIDSMLGGRPSAQESHREGASAVTVSRFPDGSITVTSIEPSAVMTRSVDGCTVNAATYATNCRVCGWLGPVEMSFRSSYTKADRNASIYNWGQKSWGCWPGTCSEPKFTLVRRNQSGNAAAQLNLTTNYNFGMGNSSVTLTLYAKDRQAWTP